MRISRPCLLTMLRACTFMVVGSAAAAHAQWPPAVKAALDSSGGNRAELETVLRHYAAGSDSLKSVAAQFLIANMEGHSYIEYELRDTTGAAVPFEILDYPDLDSLEAAFKLLEAAHGTLDFKPKATVTDLETISAEFLIAHVDDAFAAWQELPWARALPFDLFLEYVLPYRGSNEPLEAWRPEFRRRYAAVAGELADSTDAIAAAARINNDIMSWFRFNSRYYYHPTDQGLAEMLDRRMGRCEDMTNLTIFAMRANGLAVTSDFTPFWANSGNNHAWNAIVTAERRVIPFMGAEANPGEYALANRVAKVYRKTFSKQPGNLAFQPRKQRDMPRYLSGKSYTDVTADYTSVCDVTVPLTAAIPDTIDIAYLCVFNSGKWQPVQWGRIAGDSVMFAAMGVDVAYLPAFYAGGESIPAGLPFILTADCRRSDLRPDSARLQSVTLAATTRRQLVMSTDGTAASALTAGATYALHVWDNGWHELRSVVAGSEPLKFDGLPGSGLYWLTAKDSDREERIFTTEAEHPVWW